MEIVTDNRPQYVGKPYNDLCSKWSIKHTTTSLRCAPRETGMNSQRHHTECSKTGNDIQIGMQHLRCTSIDTNLPIPSEIMFNHPA